MRSPIPRPLFLPILLLVCAMLPATARRGAPARTRKEPLQWGLYHILWSRGYGDRLREEVAKFATAPAYVMFYRDLGRAFPRRAVEAIHAIGATPLVSMELWQWHGGRKDSYLPAINRGDYDAFLQDWARDARKDGRRVLLRFGFEFNGDWFSWSHDPAGFIAAWRRAHGIFRRQRATHVEWVWSPNVVSCPDTRENRMQLYYPGDAFVDWVSLDGYNFGDHHDKWHRWQSFEQVFGRALRDFEKRYPKKPVILSEFGCAPGSGRQRAEWIRDAFRALGGYPQVRAVVWFHYDKRREGEPDWRIDTTAESLRAFNETFAAPRAGAADPPGRGSAATEKPTPRGR